MSRDEWEAKITGTDRMPDYRRECDADEIIKLRAENAALAEQNAKMREFIMFALCDVPMGEYAFNLLLEALALPDISTPIINRVKAEAYRECADFIHIIGVDWEEAGAMNKRFACDYLHSSLQAKANELDGKK